MCGIAGAYTPGHPVDAGVLAKMSEQLVHRGPDGSGTWVGEDIGLTMRRLAIVDLQGGRQPLMSEDQAIRVVFNGELYNHRTLREELARRGHQLASESDGEVIPHLYEEYGPGFAERLEGIFAIALWDSRRRALILVRDHFGVKPLYLYRARGGIRFASELKALLCDPGVPRRLDLAALDAHLTFRFTPSPQTLLEGVEKLEPATWLELRSDGSERRAHYWSATPTERRDLSLEAAAEELRERLRGAVHRQMMSDRPIGAMLSGGIDSAAIVAFMAEKSTQVKTFTVGFEGGGDSDETALARATAKLFGTDHHEIVLPAGDVREELPATIAMLEEPVGTSSAVGFREVARLARPLVPVLLSGQGADEPLAGYWRYVGEAIASRTLAVVDRLALRRPVAAVASQVRSARLQRGLLALRHPDTVDRFLSIYAVLTPEQKAVLYGTGMRDAASSAVKGPRQAIERLRQPAVGRDSLAQMLYVDTRLWLPDDLLLVGDKMTMAESVEMRVPFLDRDLVEFVESLPTSYKLRRGVRKLVHKRAMEPLLPKQIVHRKERGFATPMDRWMRGEEMGDYVRDVLLDPGGTVRGVLDPGAIGNLISRHRSGAGDHTRQLFSLLSVELWAQRFLRV